MSSTINYASYYTAGGASGGALLNTGCTGRINPDSFQPIFTPSNGTTNLGGQVERIIYTPVGTCTAAIMRLFLCPGSGAAVFPVGEVQLPAYTTSNTAAAGTAFTLEAVDNPNMFPILVPAGWQLVATISATQLQQEIALNNIAQAQTTAGAAYANLNGTNVTAASTTAIASAAAATQFTPMTLSATPYVMTNPGLLSLTSAANVSTVSFKVVGRGTNGQTITETITGPNNATVYSANVYAAILSVTPLQTNAGTTSVGYSAVAGSTILPLPSPIIIQSGANLSAVNFTITGTSPDFDVISETIAGPNSGVVQSTKNYSSILTVATSAAAASNFTIGTPAIMSGWYVLGMGGSA
ncbi:MAG: hypothetical protein ACXV8Q_00595 [Methylobacter sp.]